MIRFQAVMDGTESSIKRYTEQLAQDPKSRVFVPLCDAYRQLGRYEEAIAVAQEGLKNHPTYLSGKIALARSYFENGDAEPATNLLDAILLTSPDNLLANRILAEICIQKGDRSRAIAALQGILSTEPGDARAKKMLESLAVQPPAPIGSPSPEPPSVVAPQVQAPEPKSPLQTPTIAELYRVQGHKEEALGVYRELKAQDPANPMFAAKVTELEREAAPKKPVGRPGILERFLVRIQERRRAL